MPTLAIENPCPGSGTPVGAAIPTGFAEGDPYKCPVCQFVVNLNPVSHTLRKHPSRESRTATMARMAQPPPSRTHGQVLVPPVDLPRMAQYLSRWVRQLQIEWLQSGASPQARDPRLLRAYQHAASLRALVDTVAAERAAKPVEYAMKLLTAGVGICPLCNCLHLPDDPACRAKRPRNQPVVP